MLKQLMTLFFNTIKDKILNCVYTVKGESNIEIDSSLDRTIYNEVGTLNNKINSVNSKVMNIIDFSYMTLGYPFKPTDNLSNTLSNLNTINELFKEKITQFSDISYDELNNFSTFNLSALFSYIEKSNTQSIQYTLLTDLPVTSSTVSSSRPITNESGYSNFIVKYLYKVDISSITFTPEYLIFFYNDTENYKHNIFCVYHITSMSEDGKFTEYSFEMISYCTSSNVESYIKGNNTTFNLPPAATPQLSSVFVQGRYTSNAYSGKPLKCIVVGK